MCMYSRMRNNQIIKTPIIHITTFAIQTEELLSWPRINIGKSFLSNSIKIREIKHKCATYICHENIHIRNNSNSYRHRRTIRNPYTIGLEGKIRGEAAIRSMETNKISELIKTIDRVRSGQVNIRDIDRRDISSIKELMTAYGVPYWSYWW